VRTFTLRRIVRFAQGANALEYALMLILVALIILGGAGAVGTNLKEWRVNQSIVR
jgi:Flp pilus assembly pilin Flp